MRTGFSTGLSRWMPALMSVVFMAALLWSAGASASPSAHGHHPTTQGRTAPIAPRLMATLKAATPADTPCHHERDRALPPCCVGLGCVALHVGILADALPLTPPRRAGHRPVSPSLLEGEGVPPDLPPPRLA